MNYDFVRTFAGSSSGYADGIGTSARFSSPHGMAVDAAGNIYVADAGNHCIRKISPNGVSTTFAGSTNSGYADGIGANAQFNSPSGVAVDAWGNVYVADSDNHCIRKISPDGVSTTLAGSTNSGYADGTGTNAQFDNPTGVAVDAAGNVYVVDQNNHRIRQISPNGVVRTLAGGSPGYADGTGANAQFRNPSGVAVDAMGNVYVADFLNHRIRQVSPDGVVRTLAGSGSPGSVDGIGANAQFYNPIRVAVDASGNVYVADWFNNRIRKITH